LAGSTNKDGREFRGGGREEDSEDWICTQKKMYKVDAGKKTDICNSPNRFSHSDNGQPLNYREFHIISFSEKDVV